VEVPSVAGRLMIGGAVEDTQMDKAFEELALDSQGEPSVEEPSVPEASED
jgi:hypothetical protein